jgi:diaminohydroxyphosphoribosylaminopyrimidine deaminase / 5-amino-6-(5-phosphoribosylamino)uracil reductase
VIDSEQKSDDIDHGFFMQRCIDLALLGASDVFPNPMVGCVVVSDGKIIAEGYHQKYGEAHAEVNALKQITSPEMLDRATVYVSLEPCAHFGQTPPCAKLLIEKGIKKVVIGCHDSFTKVDGKGIQLLKNAGVEVIIGVLEQECLLLNERFFHFHAKKQPYIALKWAQSKDGFFAPLANTGIHWITDAATQQVTHFLRSKEHAILVGVTTVLIDNPRLDVRAVDGKSPIRIVLDPSNKLNELAVKPKIFDGTQTTLVLNASLNVKKTFAEFISIAPFTLENCLTKLYDLNIISVLVEGGANTLKRFIDEGLWNKAYVFEGQKELTEGLISPEFLFNHARVSEQLQTNDTLTIYTHSKNK